MTEADPVAALAAQLEQLRGQIGSLRARHSGDYGHVMVLMLEVRKPGRKTGAAIARRQAGEPGAVLDRPVPRRVRAAAPAPCGSGPGRSPASSSRRTWPRFPPCWEARPEASWELANLMAERGRIYGDPDNRDPQGALWWFERWFPVVLARLGQAIRCDAAGCRMARSSP